jgi:hypothetical protein
MLRRIGMDPGFRRDDGASLERHFFKTVTFATFTGFSP